MYISVDWVDCLGGVVGEGQVWDDKVWFRKPDQRLRWSLDDVWYDSVIELKLALLDSDHWSRSLIGANAVDLCLRYGDFRILDIDDWASRVQEWAGVADEIWLVLNLDQVVVGLGVVDEEASRLDVGLVKWNYGTPHVKSVLEDHSIDFYLWQRVDAQERKLVFDNQIPWNTHGCHNQLNLLVACHLISLVEITQIVALSLKEECEVVTEEGAATGLHHTLRCRRIEPEVIYRVHFRVNEPILRDVASTDLEGIQGVVDNRNTTKET